jgi:hypothetical protein
MPVDQLAIGHLRVLGSFVSLMTAAYSSFH